MVGINTARLRKDEQVYETGYVSSPIKENQVIEGYFYPEKPMTIREMVTRKINKSLCFCLAVAICITFVSYYISMNYEAKLNNLDKEIETLNAENQDLQTELDRYKSFNNVDNKVGEYNLLKKAESVIEVTAITVTNKKSADKAKTASAKFDWSIGY